MSRLRLPVQLVERQRLLAQQATLQSSLRLDGVLHQAADLNVLRVARQLVASRRGSTTRGPDGVDPRRLSDDVLAELGADLRLGLHRHAEPHFVDVPKVNGGYRRIAIPPAIDRVADTAVALAIRPVIDADLPACSFGYRQGFGTYQALCAAGRLIADCQPGEVLLRLDVADCFPSITWSKLRPSLERRFIDPDLFAFIQDLLAGKGVPQGSPLAPALVDCHLTPLLQDVANHGRGIMFGDDLAVVCKNADEAAGLMNRLARTAHGLGLEFAAAKTRVVPVEHGVSFLGYDLALKDEKLVAKASSGVAQALEARLMLLVKRARGTNAGKFIRRVNEVLRGWGEYYRHDRDALSEGFNVAHGVVLAWLYQRFPRRLVHRHYLRHGSVVHEGQALLDPTGLYQDFPVAAGSGRSAPTPERQATGCGLIPVTERTRTGTGAGSGDRGHRVAFGGRCARESAAPLGGGAKPIEDTIMTKQASSRFIRDEVPVQLPEDLLSMPAETYADEFNKAVAVRARLAEQIVETQGAVAEAEHAKRVHEAKVRNDARLAQLQVTKQQLKDELLLDKAYGRLCKLERDLLDRQRRLRAQHEAVDVMLRGWSRTVEVRRQEMTLMNPPSVSRRRK